MENHCPLATDPGDNSRPIFVVVPPTRARVSCGAPALDGPTPSSHPAALAPCCPPCGRGHPLPPCPPIGGASRRTGPHCAATSTSGSWCGYGPPALGQSAATSRRDRAERSRESSMATFACSDGGGYQ